MGLNQIDWVMFKVFLRPFMLTQSLKLYSSVSDSPHFWLFGLCYAMDGGYIGCNPYIERHLAIFVDCF
jgi:hypothetical protein